MPPPDTSSETPPPPIPDYELLRLIGRGSYGDVWLARSATGLFRAVKIVWRSRFQDHGPYEREFNGLREFARITAGETRQLSLLHVGRNDGQGFFYYVMDLADDVVTGREIDPACYEPLTFRTYRETDTHPPIKEVIHHAIELARGLAELHSTGHLHRDIKPSNIIVVHGRPKLADIGLVAHASEALTFVGTEGFMPPEGPGTPAADIYSFGKVLYELATGRDRHDFPRLPEDFGQRTDHRELLELNEIILRACAADPRQRYPDVKSLLDELQLLEAGRSVRRLRRAEAGLARARKWIIAAVAIATVAATGAYFERQRANLESAGRRAAEEALARRTRESLYESSIANAQRALEAKELGLARQALADGRPQPGDPDLRGFEWYALAREARGDPARILRESGPRIDRLLLSPDRNLLAIDDDGPFVEVLDLATGETRHRFEGIHRIAGFTPDGRRLIGTTPDYGIETWSLADGSPDPRPNEPGIHRPIQVASDRPHLLYFQDGIGGDDHRLAVRDLEHDRDVWSLTIPRLNHGLTWDYYMARADDNLEHVALVLVNGTVNQFHYQTTLWQRRSDHPEPIWHNDGRIVKVIDFDRTGRRFVLGWPDGEFDLLDEGKPAITWTRPEYARTQSRSGGLSPDGRLLALASRDRSLTIVDAATGTLRNELRGHANVVSAQVWLDDSRQVITGSRSGDVRLWSVDGTPAPPKVFQGPPVIGDMGSIRLIPERGGNRVFLPTSPDASYLFDPASGKRSPAPAGLSQVLDFTTERLVWLSQEMKIKRSNPDHPERPAADLQIFTTPAPVRHAAVSPNGRWLVASNARRELVLWDLAADTRVGQLFLDADTACVAVSDQGQVIFADFGQTLQTWDLRAHRLLASLKIMSRPSSLILSADNRWMILNGGAIGCEVRRVETLERVLVFDGSYNTHPGFAFSPDSSTIACPGPIGSVRLFRLDADDRWTQRPTLYLATPGATEGWETAQGISFTGDGNTLLVRNYAGRARVWRN